MFIALQNHTCALQRSAMCLVRPDYIPLLKERDRSGIWGYKHVAPPEQEPSIAIMTTFRAKPVVSAGCKGRAESLNCFHPRPVLPRFALKILDQVLDRLRLDLQHQRHRPIRRGGRDLAAEPQRCPAEHPPAVAAARASFDRLSHTHAQRVRRGLTLGAVAERATPNR
jgi:hypothetical protein